MYFSFDSQIDWDMDGYIRIKFIWTNILIHTLTFKVLLQVSVEGD